MQKPTVKIPYTNMPKDEGEIISVYLWREHRDLVIKFKKLGESYNPEDESDEQVQVGVDIMNERVQVGLRIIDFLKKTGREIHGDSNDLGGDIYKYL